MNWTNIIICFGILLLLCMITNQTETFEHNYIDQNLKCFVINLENRPQKKKYMQHQLTQHNLNHTIFSAINGSQLNLDLLTDLKVLDQIGAKDYMKRNLRRGEIGCALSHTLIWNQLLKDKSNVKYYLIFEDDAILNNNFRNKLEEILKDIENLDWDVLYLNENCYRHFGKNCDGNEFSKTTLKPTQIGYGLYGYIINRKFVQKCIENHVKFPPLFPMYMPIDDYLNHTSRLGIFKCIRSKEILVGVNKQFDSDTIGIK